MRTFFYFIFTSLILTTLVISCSKDEEKEGCTDEAALNYNLLSVIDDGSCEYLDSSFTIWENGEVGFFGNPITGTLEVKSCPTNITTALLNPDSLITPPDTVIDNLVTPPDTTITPGDTTITGDTYLSVNSDINGTYKLIIQLLNNQNATDFKNGHLIFEAKLHPDANISDFELMIYGNNLNTGGIYCTNFYSSDLITISTSILDTNDFAEISIPFTDFTSRNFNDIDLVFGIRGSNAAPNTQLLLINSIKWVSNLQD